LVTCPCQKASKREQSIKEEISWIINHKLTKNIASQLMIKKGAARVPRVSVGERGKKGIAARWGVKGKAVKESLLMTAFEKHIQ